MMTIDERLEQCQSLVEAVGYPTVQNWKAGHPGGHVVGMFPVYAPYELPHAAGMLPIGIYGAGGRVEIDHADSRIQSFVCSIARSTLELGLREMLSDVDVLWFPSICDVARNLSGIWQANFPAQHVDYVHFPQNMTSAAAPVHYRAELQRLLANLEVLRGAKVAAEQLRASIQTYNRNRALCAKIYEVKNATPWLLSASEAYLLMRLGTLMPVEEHTRLLEEVLPQIHSRSTRRRDYVRVMIEGSFCEQPPLELLRVIEEAGCYVVDDDLVLQTRWFDGDVSDAGDPLLSLAESYIRQSRYSSVRHYGNRPRKVQFIEKIRARNIDGVIFCAPKFCEPALLDYVVLKDELEKQGIAYLTFEYEEKMGVFESIRTQVETFVESVLFFS